MIGENAQQKLTFSENTSTDFFLFLEKGQLDITLREVRFLSSIV